MKFTLFYDGGHTKIWTFDHNEFGVPPDTAYTHFEIDRAGKHIFMPHDIANGGPIRDMKPHIIASLYLAWQAEVVGVKVEFEDVP
jgi:hypothetical protein